MAAVKEPQAATLDAEQPGEVNVAREPAVPREGLWYVADDSAAELKPGQARRGEYLRALERVVYETAEEGLARMGRTARDCPYLRAMFRFYSRRDAAGISAAVRRYAPEAAWAASAAESARMVGWRVNESVRVWADTGRINRAPDLAGDTAHLRSSVGEPLDGAARGRMEQAFGENFGGVRVHRDGPAEKFAAQENAWAVTVGQDIYFARDRFQPGTLVGDAILAHELAHAVQQRSGAHEEIADRRVAAEYERDADRAAASAVHSIWTRSLKATAHVIRRANVSLRSGLSIQRCAPVPPAVSTTAPSVLTIASSGFKPSGGGPLEVNDMPSAPPKVQVLSAAYYSEGDVTASGGTDAEASDWQAGFLQTVVSSRQAFEFQDQSGTRLGALGGRLPGPTRDGIRGTTAPWYDASRVAAFARTNSTLHPAMGDQPTREIFWTITTKSGVEAQAAGSTGKDEFCSWMVVRQLSTGNITYLNWDTWEVDWSATLDPDARTGSSTGTGTRITGQGEGQGSVPPVLDGPLAKEAMLLEKS